MPPRMIGVGVRDKSQWRTPPGVEPEPRLGQINPLGVFKWNRRLHNGLSLRGRWPKASPAGRFGGGRLCVCGWDERAEEDPG